VISGIDFAIAFHPCEVADKLLLSDEEREVKGLHKFEFESVEVGLGDASNFGVELILVIEIVEVFGGDHDAADEQPR
jgi:hypothetical protein